MHARARPLRAQSFRILENTRHARQRLLPRLQVLWQWLSSWQTQFWAPEVQMRGVPDVVGQWPAAQSALSAQASPTAPAEHVMLTE